MSKELIEQLGLGHTNSNMFERNDLGLPKSVKGTVNHFFTLTIQKDMQQWNTLHL